jgi:hypothetical protein
VPSPSIRVSTSLPLSSAQVQRHGCTALAVLGVHDTTGVAKAGGARAAVCALMAQPNVWEAAWGALHCLTNSSAEGREAVLQAGGVEALQNAMRSGDPAIEGAATGSSREGVMRELLHVLTATKPPGKKGQPGERSATRSGTDAKDD